MSEAKDERVTVVLSIMDGITEARDSADMNMFDRPRVIQWLQTDGFYKAAVWVEENPLRYADSLFKGFKVGEENDTDA